MNHREKTKRSENPSFEPMRVAILGVGGLGRTLASELRGDPRVTSLLLVDLFGERARVLTGIRGRVAIEAKQLNVENRIALTKAIAGSDLVINTTLPKYNLGIMQAALEVRADYLDPSAAGPREAGGLAGISPEQAKVVVLKDALDFSFAEIAEAVDMPVGTAKCYAHRARAGLRTRLKRDVA